MCYSRHLPTVVGKRMTSTSSPPPWYLEPLRSRVPHVVAVAEDAIVAVREASALDYKVKLLISLAIDIASGNHQAVERMGDRCRAAGATEAEIADAIAMACLNGALQRLGSGSHAFEGVTLPPRDAQSISDGAPDSGHATG